MKRVHLIIIDPQNDFCDPKGALFVNGADKDMERLASLIERISGKIDDIHITLDSHQKVHVAHPIFWKDSAGRRPNPFTIISAAEVRNGQWTTTAPQYYGRALAYVEALEKNGRYPLCIWPPHCLIGTPGQCVHPRLVQALDKWTDEFATIDFVTKGSNPFTEHYSAIVADVPDPDDHTTQLNTRFLDTVNQADIVLLAGEAGSHCLANTGRDACNYFTDDSFVKKLVLLKDATSPVGGFEKLQDDFITDMTKRGMQVTTCADFLA